MPPPWFPATMPHGTNAEGTSDDAVAGRTQKGQTLPSGRTVGRKKNNKQLIFHLLFMSAAWLILTESIVTAWGTVHVHRGQFRTEAEPFHMRVSVSVKSWRHVPKLIRNDHCLFIIQHPLS